MVDAELQDVVVDGVRGAPPVGRLRTFQLVGIPPGQITEETLLGEQRVFDEGRFDDAYLVLRRVDPEDREVRELSAWELRASFAVKRGRVHFLGAGYSMDASFAAARAAVSAAGVVPADLSDLDFVTRVSNELFGVSAATPMIDAIDAARAGAAERDAAERSGAISTEPAR